MIRVAIGVGSWWLGGLTYARNLLNAIAAIPDRRIEPVILVGTAAGESISAALPAVETIATPWVDRGSPRWMARKASQRTLHRDPFLERVLRANGIDVLSHSDFLGSHAAIPAICWIPDFQHRTLPQMFSGRQRWYRDGEFRLMCRHSSAIVLSSADSQRALADFEPAAVAKSRVLHFVAQPDPGAATSEPELRSHYGIEGPYFYVPNQFWAHKNHRLIIAALAELRSRGCEALVVATGATQDNRHTGHFEGLMAYARDAGVAESFRSLGVVPRPDVVGLMLGSLALLNPSRSEGWSTSVEEAKSLGKRIVLSDLAVHLEQAPPDGIYVGVDDPVALAEAMERVAGEFDPAVERERAARAAAALPGRVRAFGEQYQAIVLEAANRA